MKMIKGITTTMTMSTTRLALLVTLFALTTAVVIVKSDSVPERGPVEASSSGVETDMSGLGGDLEASSPDGRPVQEIDDDRSERVEGFAADDTPTVQVGYCRCKWMGWMPLEP